jgi:hypothetical protein
MQFFQNNNEPLIESIYESNRCIFCLQSTNSTFVSIVYKQGTFVLNEKKYKFNCPCFPVAHESCMNSWLIESTHCPECSVNLTETVVENKKYSRNIAGLCFAIFLVFGIVAVVVVACLHYSQSFNNGVHL